jgi:DNA-binding NarL/FixJ family response regulator
MHDEAMYAERGIRSGARGYLMKQAPVREVVHAIRRILDGGIYLSGKMRDRILKRVLAPEAASS